MLGFWIGFHILILAMVFWDLKGFKNPLKAVVFWVFLGLGFNAFIAFYLGKQAALDFFTAYVVETSLSVDNLFVFFMLFSFFGIQKEFQHRVLFWGVLGAFAFRIIFILLGIALLESFAWMYLVFGAVLCCSAIYMWKSHGIDIQKTRLFSMATKILPIDWKEKSDRFFISKEKKFFVTPLFLSLLFIEASDLLFAIDSIPAVLAITKDSFLAYTSNVFAVLGLRSFYLLLARAQERLEYLKPAILCILLFIGLKMLLSAFFHISNLVSLIAVLSILSSFIVFHFLTKKIKR